MAGKLCFFILTKINKIAIETRIIAVIMPTVINDRELSVDELVKVGVKVVAVTEGFSVVAGDAYSGIVKVFMLLQLLEEPTK